MNKGLVWLLLAYSIAVHAGEDPSVLVKTEPIRRQPLVFELSGYGAVIPDPGGTVNINLPRSGQIVRLNATLGQVVARGAPLFEFVTDPVAASGYAQARSSLEFAKGEYDRIDRQFQQQLATRSQLAAARKALLDAENAVLEQQKLGSGIGLDSVKAPFDAVVTVLSTVPGDRIQAGRTVLQISRRDALRVQIGIRPEDSSRVKPGMPVRLIPVFDPRRQLAGVVGEVHGMINPRTQLVDVLVKIDRSQSRSLVPGMPVRGLIEVRTETAWVVPRSAVLTDARGAYIYQNDMGHARRVDVTAHEDGNLTGIGGNFDPKLPVVVLGNYELRNGMALREAEK